MPPKLRTGAALAAALTVFLGIDATLAERSSSVPARPDDRTIVHALNRLGFGPAPGDVERVRRMGLAAYIERQLQPDHVADEGMAARLSAFETLNMSSRQLAEDYFIPAQQAHRQRRLAQAKEAAEPQALTPEQREAMRGQREVLVELSQQRILRAIYSERQLQEVLVDFWFNHFNVFAGKGQTRVYLTEYERDAIRPHVLGRFRDLLQATAASPAMLFYLDNWQSAAAPDASTTTAAMANRRPFRRLGPNRARTLADMPPALQNRRPRGLNENYARELMELHTMGVDSGYTQKDVQEVARAFTGWTIANPRQGGGFQFEPRLHDDGEKVVLGHRIKAGGGKKDGEQVLDILASHPATARFIATKLARRFVADDPPKPLVDRAAARFTATRGDIREVVRAIVTSPEFFAADAYRAKVKTPFDFVVSAIRATGAEATTVQPVVATLRDLGMPLYGCQPPTGYADKAEAWVNTGALLNRMNFAVALTGGRVRGMHIPAETMRLAPGDAPAALVSGVLAGELSAATASTVAKAQAAPQALALVLGSPEFQRK